MSIGTTTSGLRVKESPFEACWLIADETRLDECVPFMNSGEFADFMGVLVSRDLGFPSMDLSFLNRTPSLHGLWVSDNVADATPVGSLANLRVLRLAENRYRLDLSAFPELKEVGFDWSAKLAGLSACTKMEKMTIGSFNPKTKDLSVLSPLESLQDLSIVRSNIESVDGLENHSQMRRLSLSYCPRLERIDSLPSTLCDLELDGCKSLTGHSIVSRLRHLQKLTLSRAGNMRSLSFISELKALEHLSFVDTPVENGDMGPLLQHPRLAAVGYDNKRHYSIKCEVVSKRLKEKRTDH